MYSLSGSVEKAIRRAGGGGNTNAVRQVVEVSEHMLMQGITIKYVDFCSLYPWVMLATPMCIGMPDTTRYETPGLDGPTPEKLKTFFGFIECDFVPPKGLFHPVLLKNTDNMIVRSLDPIKETCVTSVECQLAMEKGYVVTNVRAIHEFQESRTILRPYLQNFLRLKIESEDYSEDGVPDEERIAEV